ncbi:MAG: hypothetical protein SXQ77_08885 [Halobacteria archaeon]|nr:hypothetical protein [Halobacteria archaeon]
MGLVTLALLPVSPFMLKVGVFVLALLSLVTGYTAFRSLEKEYENNQSVSRKYYHVVVNILTLLAAAVLVVGETSHEGWITLMFAVTAFISGIFTYRSMQVQMERGDDQLDKPSMHMLYLDMAGTRNRRLHIRLKPVPVTREISLSNNRS